MKTQQKCIMVVDDNRLAAAVLGDILEQAGYLVLKAESGIEALRLVQQGPIDLVLLDIMMPDMDGYEVVRQLRNDTRTYNTPILLLSSYQGTAEKVKGFELGADDYITKPFVPEELLARVMAHLRRSRLTKASNPLTGLPGNATIEDQLIEMVASGQPFAVLYIDLDNFKAYNDAYGFLQGDEMIRLLANVLQQILEQYGNRGDLLGHIGGDDFVLITTPDKVDIICEQIISQFEFRRRHLYEVGSEDLLPATLSIAAVSNEFQQFSDHLEVAKMAATLKQKAKSIAKSAFVKSGPMLQSKDAPSVLVIDDDRLVSAVLQANFEQKGYNIMLVNSVLAATLAMRNHRPDLVLLDVFLPGTSGFAFCRRLKTNPETAGIPILMVSSTPAKEQALEAGADDFLQKPFNITVLMKTVDRLLHDIRRNDGEG
ncbi:MAG TPA: response regulator [Firmicutes bacterium]|nr:response regulator [Bacillota bacterium]